MAPESRLVPAILHCPGEGLDSDLGWLEVWLPEAELHGIVACHIEHPPYSRWTNAIGAVGESHHGLRTNVLGFEQGGLGLTL